MLKISIKNPLVPQFLQMSKFCSKTFNAFHVAPCWPNLTTNQLTNLEIISPPKFLNFWPWGEPQDFAEISVYSMILDPGKNLTKFGFCALCRLPDINVQRLFRKLTILPWKSRSRSTYNISFFSQKLAKSSYQNISSIFWRIKKIMRFW